MTTTEKCLNIHERLHAIMVKISYIQKNQQKVNGQYTFVKSDDVIAKLREPLLDEKVILIPTVVHSVQEGNRTIVKVEVKFVCVDNPSDFVTVEYWGHGIDNQDKGIGKAVTYAIKYALLKVFLLETGDAADVEAHSVDYEPPAPTAPPAPPKEKSDKEGFIASFSPKDQAAVRGAIAEFAASRKMTEEEIVSKAQDRPIQFATALKPYLK